MIENTLSIIKPDATDRNLVGKINVKFEESGLKIIAQKRLLLTVQQAKDFYSIHAKRQFFQSLIDFMTSGPVVAQILSGQNAIDKNRYIMGATDPSKAANGTIRKEFALDIQKNSVHGSDSKENAEKEIAYFFSKLEIF